MEIMIFDKMCLYILHSFQVNAEYIRCGWFSDYKYVNWVVKRKDFRFHGNPYSLNNGGVPTKRCISQGLSDLSYNTKLGTKLILRYLTFSWLLQANYLIWSFMIIYDNIRNQSKIAEKLRGYTFKITYISAAYWTTGQNLASKWCKDIAPFPSGLIF